MVRPVPALLAVLLVLSAPGVASLAGTPGTPVTPARDAATVEQSRPANTTSLLLLDDVRASNFTQPEPNLATALSMQGSELDGELTRRSIEHRLSTLGTVEAQRTYLLNVSAELRRTVDGMLAAEERARRLYNDGELNASEYARELSRLSGRAESLSEPLAVVSRAQTSAISDSQLRTRIGKLDADLVIFQGSILDRTSAVVRGEDGPFDLHVSTSENGAVLTMIDGREYVREAYRADYVDPVAPIISLGEAEARMAQMYPWLQGLPTQLRSLQVSGLKNGVWWIRDQHPHGRLSFYFYGNTSGPYREVQHKSLPDYPFESPEETFGSDVVLAVNRTYAGGPMEVRLTNQTGVPLHGEIRIDGSSVGSTGVDGRLWALQPEGWFTVVAVHEGERLSLELGRSTAEFADEE